MLKIRLLLNTLHIYIKEILNLFQVILNLLCNTKMIRLNFQISVVDYI